MNQLRANEPKRSINSRDHRLSSRRRFPFFFFAIRFDPRIDRSSPPLYPVPNLCCCFVGSMTREHPTNSNPNQIKFLQQYEPRRVSSSLHDAVGGKHY